VVDAQGLITFFRISDGRQLLRTVLYAFGPVIGPQSDLPPSTASTTDNTPGVLSLVSAKLRFSPIRGERVYGLGEHRTGSLQNKPISVFFQHSQVHHPHYKATTTNDTSLPRYMTIRQALTSASLFMCPLKAMASCGIYLLLGTKSIFI